MMMYIHKKCGIVKGSKIQPNKKATVFVCWKYHKSVPPQNPKQKSNEVTPQSIQSRYSEPAKATFGWTFRWMEHHEVVSVAKENIPSLPMYLQDGPVIKRAYNHWTSKKRTLFLSERHDSWFLLTSRKRSRGNKNNMFRFDWISLE